MVRRISLGMTTLPRSSILLTIPVAFILYLSPYILVALLLFVRICGLCVIILSDIDFLHVRITSLALTERLNLSLEKFLQITFKVLTNP